MKNWKIRVDPWIRQSLHGLKPYVYLTYVLDQLRQMGPFPKPEELDRLLPWSDDLPDEFRTKNKR